MYCIFFNKMPKTIANRVITTRAQPDEYYIRDKIYNVFYPTVIDSTCVKRELDPYGHTTDCGELYTNTLTTPSTQYINIDKLETNFERFGDDVKQLMDVTTYLEETLKSYSLRGNSSFGRDGGNASFEYKQTSTLCGVVTIYFNWSRGDEMGFVDWEEDETHVIPGVIYQNHKYYAVTNPFIDWLRTPAKPKRQAFLNELLFQ